MVSKEELLAKISRNSAVVGELKSSTAWQIIREDFLSSKQKIDDAWAYIPEDQQDKLRELKIAKLATLQILNLLDNYEHDLKQAQDHLAKSDDPEGLNSGNYGASA